MRAPLINKNPDLSPSWILLYYRLFDVKHSTLQILLCQKMFANREISIIPDVSIEAYYLLTLELPINDPFLSERSKWQVLETNTSCKREMFINFF